MNTAWESPIIRISSGQLNTVNDLYIGGQASISSRSRFAGQLGKRVFITPDAIAPMYKSTVGTLYGGSYRYVRMRTADTTAIVVGQILFWDTTVTNWQTAYQVTRDETLSSADAGVLIAGVAISIPTPGNYFFIQDMGMVPVKLRGTLTVAAAIGQRVYAAGAGGADMGLGDTIASDILSLANSRYLGIGTTAAVAGALGPVILGFHNAIM